MTPPIFFRTRSATASVDGSGVPSFDMQADSREDIDAPMGHAMTTAQSFPDGLLLPQRDYLPANPSPLSRSHTLGSSAGGSSGSPVSPNSLGGTVTTSGAHERPHSDSMNQLQQGQHQHFHQQYPESTMAVEMSDDVHVGGAASTPERTSNGNYAATIVPRHNFGEGEVDMRDANQQQHQTNAHNQQHHCLDTGMTAENAGTNSSAVDSHMKRLSSGNSPLIHGSGRQMSRYTLGYREDCELCRAKTPGHFTHILSAPSDS